MISAKNELTKETEYYLVQGVIPQEFRNEGTTSTERFANATTYLHKEDTLPCSTFRILLNVAEEQLRIHLRDGGSPHKKISKNVYRFEMKHNWALTKSMYEAGWRQWASTVTTAKSSDIDDGCRFLGRKKKDYRVTVHFWVSPDKDIALGKIKLKNEGVGMLGSHIMFGDLLDIDNLMCEMASRAKCRYHGM